jgi:hypothetical protein
MSIAIYTLKELRPSMRNFADAEVPPNVSSMRVSARRKSD